MQKHDFTIPTLGSSTIKSPMSLSKKIGDFMANYVDDNLYIIDNIETKADAVAETPKKENLLEIAGPREKIFFQPKNTHAAVVTCGGLCPGLNDVIRAIVMSLWYHYGVKKITGIKFGYKGLIPDFKIPTIKLNPEHVENIHQQGGTILGSSRGHGDNTEKIVDTLQNKNINILFTIGGDGTQKGALDIVREIKKRKLNIAVVGIPKTIDNDLSFIQRSFGFETAVGKALDAVTSAHTEAHDAVNGIGLVKVMGRQSGFIAAQTALASNDVNFCLVPEVPFELKGKNGLLAQLEERLKKRNHAVVLAAEGAGQNLLEKSQKTDKSGNPKLDDIGLLLKSRITQYFNQKNRSINLKYIDPGYIIRSAPANPNDSVYCARLGTNAVHAAMAGKTQTLIGLLHNRFVHIPINIAVAEKNKINPDGPLWRNVIEITGQPQLMLNQTKNT